MREILFRGKSVSNNEWVKGFYEYSYMYDSLRECHRIIWADKPTRTNYLSEVIPETVGQYTEMEDKHGKKIFEGDIIYRDWHGGRTYQVTYDNLFGGFMGVTSNGAFTTFDGDSDFFEVIGNIYDNPELMDN